MGRLLLELRGHDINKSRPDLKMQLPLKSRIPIHRRLYSDTTWDCKVETCVGFVNLIDPAGSRSPTGGIPKGDPSPVP